MNLSGQSSRARNAEMGRVLNEGGTMTPFGWLSLEADWHGEDGDDIGATLKRHLSHAASVYELMMVYPVFQVAAGRKDKDMTIMLYQFDAVSIDVRPSRRERVIAAVQNASQAVADRFGIPTCLEVSEREQ
jgi:hypothetical protein